MPKKIGSLYFHSASIPQLIEDDSYIKTQTDEKEQNLNFIEDKSAKNYKY